VGDHVRVGAGELDAYVGQQAEPPRVARYAVSAAMIRNWAEALGDTNAVYVDDSAARATGRPGIIAPPAMISTWIMAGYRRWREVQRLRAEGVVESTPYSQLMARLDEAGYTSVVATDVSQEYHAEVGVGTLVTAHYTIDSIVGPKTTALGEGWFVTLGKRYVDHDDHPLVTEQFRMLRFRPKDPA